MNSRREFIRKLVTISAGAAAFPSLDPFRPRFRIAEAAVGKRLLVIFQRGGCDGLNTVVPYGDGSYAGLRPTIRIPPPGSGAGAAIDLNGFFGLHPSLQPLLVIWQAGDLAILPAVQYPNASQSHFDGQQYLESGAPRDDLDGWLNRHLVSLPRQLPLRGASFGFELAHALRGQAVVSSFSSIASFTTGLPQADEDALMADLTRIYQQSPDDTKPWRGLTQDTGRVMVNDVSVLAAVDTTTYVPANGAVYPNTGLGRQLRQCAQLIRLDLGLEVATLGIGGWDTHSDQGGGDATGAQARRHDDLARSIAALWRDLGPTLMNDVVVLTMTEFGRTAEENGSAGTDHGHATAWFVVGGAVNGGRFFGQWPGLSSTQLYRGRYLNHSVDFRNVMAEVLTRHMGNTNLAAILPGHTYVPVGFL